LAVKTRQNLTDRHKWDIAAGHAANNCLFLSKYTEKLSVTILGFVAVGDNT
jgi:hypothetical protein